MRRLLSGLFGLLVLSHLFFMVRYETPFPCEAASVRVYETLSADKLIGVGFHIGELAHGKDEFLQIVVDIVAPKLRDEQGVNTCYKIAIMGIEAEDKRLWSKLLHANL